MGIENAGDNRMFIVERGGKIWISNLRGKKKPVPFLDISDRITTEGSEQGLLGLAFDPDFSTNGYFYLNYTNPEGNTHISRFSTSNSNRDSADANSEVVLLTVEQPFANHNGGQLKFGPDNYLYIALGDGGSGGDPFNNGQDPSTFLGKMLRIDVSSTSDGKEYAIPSSNPFVGMEGYLEEIWATGLRNPFRFSFDRLNGDLWIADVGQNAWEEINMQDTTSEGGENYGWGCWEGTHLFKEDCEPNATPPTFPIAEYPHTDDGCSGSIIGGHVYRGKLFPNMRGKYFYTDYCTGVFRTVYQDHGVWVNRYLATFDPFKYTSFGENRFGELFLADTQEGKIYLVGDASASLPDFSLNEDAEAQEQEIDRLTLYPNPGKGKFTTKIDAPKAEAYQIKVLDQLGQVVFSKTRIAQKGLNEWEFSSDEFKKGLWIIQMKSSKGTISKRFLIE